MGFGFLGFRVWGVYGFRVRVSGFMGLGFAGLLGRSWVVTSGVLRPRIWAMTLVVLVRRPT